MKLLVAFYALAGSWFMVALCCAAKAGQISTLCGRTEPIKISSKEIP